MLEKMNSIYESPYSWIYVAVLFCTMFGRKENKKIGMFRNEIVQGNIFYFRLQSQSDKNNTGFCFTSINNIAK